jgi:hypothetical protein
MHLKDLLRVKAFFIRLGIRLEKTPIQKKTSVDIKNGIRSHELSLQKLRINLPSSSSDGWDDNYPSLETQHPKALEQLWDLSEQEDLEAIPKLLKQDLPDSAIELINDSIDSIMMIKPIIQPMPIEANPHLQKNN